MSTLGTNPLLGRITRIIAENELAILLLASPIFLFIRPSLVPLLLLLPFLWLVRRLRWGHFVPRTPVDWSILGLLVMVLFSTWVTPDLFTSLGKITGLLYAIAVFYALVEWGRRQEDSLPVATLVAGLGTATALLSLFGTRWNAKWSFLTGLNSLLPKLVGGLPGAEFGFNPNTVSGTLITFVPLQLCVLWWLVSTQKAPDTKRRWLTWAIGLSLLATIFIIVLAQSRAAWVALALGLLSMAGIILKRFRTVFFVLVIAGILVLIVVGPVGVSDWLVQQGLATGTAEASWDARVERWSRWLWAIADHPLTGTGMDVFRSQGPEMYPFFHVSVGEDLGHAHNAYLHTALDLGIPGLISYLALLGGTIVLGWQSYRRARQRLAQLVVLGGVAGLATHAAWSMLDVLPLGARTNFMWWTVAACVITVVIGQHWGTQQDPDPEKQALEPQSDRQVPA